MIEQCLWFCSAHQHRLSATETSSLLTLRSSKYRANILEITAVSKLYTSYIRACVFTVYETMILLYEKKRWITDTTWLLHTMNKEAEDSTRFKYTPKIIFHPNGWLAIFNDSFAICHMFVCHINCPRDVVFRFNYRWKNEY